MRRLALALGFLLLWSGIAFGALPTITWKTGKLSVSANKTSGSTITLAVRLSKPSASIVTCGIVVTGVNSEDVGTGQDVSLSTATVTISANKLAPDSQPSLTIVNNPTVNVDRRAVVTLTSPTNARVGSANKLYVTIVDNARVNKLDVTDSDGSLTAAGLAADACDNTGATDCSTKLQAILTYLRDNGGGVAYFPNGTYMTGAGVGQVDIYPGTTLVGQSQAGVVLLRNPATSNGNLQYRATYSGDTDSAPLGISNLTFDGNCYAPAFAWAGDYSQEQNSIFRVQADSAKTGRIKVRAQDITVQNSSSDAFSIANNVDANIYNITAHDIFRGIVTALGGYSIINATNVIGTSTHTQWWSTRPFDIEVDANGYDDGANDHTEAIPYWNSSSQRVVTCNFTNWTTDGTFDLVPVTDTGSQVTLTNFKNRMGYAISAVGNTVAINNSELGVMLTDPSDRYGSSSSHYITTGGPVTHSTSIKFTDCKLYSDMGNAALLSPGNFTKTGGYNYVYQMTLLTDPSTYGVTEHKPPFSGNPTDLTQASSIADVDTSAGRWFWASNVLYVRATDNSNPATNFYRYFVYCFPRYSAAVAWYGANANQNKVVEFSSCQFLTQADVHPEDLISHTGVNFYHGLSVKNLDGSNANANQVKINNGGTGSVNSVFGSSLNLGFGRDTDGVQRASGANYLIDGATFNCTNMMESKSEPGARIKVSLANISVNGSGMFDMAFSGDPTSDDVYTFGSGVNVTAAANVVKGGFGADITAITYLPNPGAKRNVSGAGAPTTSTNGIVGDVYTNTSNSDVYDCTVMGYLQFMTTIPATWDKRL